MSPEPVCLRCGATAIPDPKTDEKICPACRNVVKAIRVFVKNLKNPK